MKKDLLESSFLSERITAFKYLEKTHKFLLATEKAEL